MRTKQVLKYKLRDLSIGIAALLGYFIERAAISGMSLNPLRAVWIKTYNQNPDRCIWFNLFPNKVNLKYLGKESYSGGSIYLDTSVELSDIYR